MKSIAVRKEDSALLENYLGLLHSLSREYKIKLVESLNHDIVNTSSLSNDWIDRLYGSFVSDKSAEDMIVEIRSDRRFTKEILGF